MQHIDQLTGKINTMGVLEQLAEMRAQEGLQQGQENAKRLFVENLLKEGSFSQQKIASLANVSLNFVRKIKASLRTSLGGIA